MRPSTGIQEILSPNSQSKRTSSRKDPKYEKVFDLYDPYAGADPDKNMTFSKPIMTDMPHPFPGNAQEIDFSVLDV